jgi:UDP-N-acetylmuramyl pentapeptide phosphotransferase/UDP-N-acetylglucosamine-1-phosphate transferase
VTPLVVSLLVTTAAAPLVRWAMLHHDVMDLPNHRSSHTVPTPRGGGLASLAGVVLGSAAAHLVNRDVAWAAVAAAAALGMLGFADDRASLRAVLRLGAQVLVGALAGLAVGGLWLALAGAVLVPATVNAVNFMDGINGITALTMSVWGLTAFWAGRSHDLGALEALGAVTAGAAVGFLPWNAPVARLFLGDVGSYLFGALAGAGVLLGWAHGISPVLLLAPLALYAADTATAVVRRARRGEPLMEAHRDHVYQQLVVQGRHSHSAVAAYAAALAAAITAAWAVAPAWLAVVVTVVVCGLYLTSPRLARGPHTTAAPVGGERA